PLYDLYHLPLHDALPISRRREVSMSALFLAGNRAAKRWQPRALSPSRRCQISSAGSWRSHWSSMTKTSRGEAATPLGRPVTCQRSEEHTSELQSHLNLVC